MPKAASPVVPSRRRQALSALGALGTLGALVSACGGGSDTGSSATASSNAALAGLSLSAGTLSPAFSSDTLGYTASVANASASLTVTPTAADSGASIRVNGSTVASGGTSAALALAVGSNTLSVVVTAADGSTTRTYTLVVTRADATLAADASLSSLLLSSGTLSPEFSATTLSYSANVANTVTALAFTATATDGAATVRINGVTVARGSASDPITLPVGTTTVTIVVTASDGSTTRTYSVLATRASVGTCVITPQETEGPYPLLAILSNSAVVRSDITAGKTGIPLTLTLTVQDLSNGCAPVAGAAVYIWHCDKDGLYSGYSASNNAGQAGLSYLRGIQVTDASGQVTFKTIFPGWYAGRITHIHFQIYLNNNLSVTATATSQLAFPQAITSAAYNTALYTKGQNTSVTSFAADNVFADGTTYQMAAVTGDTTNGYAASLTVTIA